MPRKSSFKNKVKVEEQTEEEQVVEQPVEEVKKIALKKDKKPRKKRSKKAKTEEPKEEEKKEEPAQKDMYNDMMSYGSEIMGSSVDDFIYEAKEVKPVKKSKSLLSKIVSAPLKVVTAPLKMVSKTFKKEEPKQEEIKEQNDEPLPEPVQSAKPTKDSIMAKLAALQASRSVVIQPKEAKKPTLKPVVKPVMKELVVTSDEKKIEQLKAKPRQSLNKKVIDRSKSYKLYIDLEQEDDLCEIDWNNDRRPDLTLYRMSFYKNKKMLTCSYFCGEKWTVNKRFQLKTMQNTITFKPTSKSMSIQIRGVTQQVVKRRHPMMGINIATWDCKTLKIV